MPSYDKNSGFPLGMLEDFENIFGGMDDLFNGYLPVSNDKLWRKVNRTPSWSSTTATETTTIIDDNPIPAHRIGDDLVISFDIPGVDPKTGLKISAKGSTLTVISDRKNRPTITSDISHRSIVLPAAVRKDTEIKARCSKGVVTITVVGIYTLAGESTVEATINTEE